MKSSNYKKLVTQRRHQQSLSEVSVIRERAERFNSIDQGIRTVLIKRLSHKATVPLEHWRNCVDAMVQDAEKPIFIDLWNALLDSIESVGGDWYQTICQITDVFLAGYEWIKECSDEQLDTIIQKTKDMNPDEISRFLEFYLEQEGNRAYLEESQRKTKQLMKRYKR